MTTCIRVCRPVVTSFGRAPIWLLVATSLFVAHDVLRAQAPLGTAFTYQGRLTESGGPVTGTYDFQFRLFDASTGGSEVGSAVTVSPVAVASGLFTVSLDFGSAAFAGSARWLEIRVRPGGTSGAYTVLVPRQALMAAPHAVHASSAATALTATTAATATTATTATNATQLAGQGASFYLDLLTHAGVLGVTQGGTGSTSATTARASLAAAKSGANTDITSLGGLTAPLSVAQGGTGVTSLAAAPFQARVTGTCEAGTTFQAINADGTVACHPPRLTASLATLESAGATGLHTSITTGTDGLGLISFYDATNGDLKVGHCANAACSRFTTPPLTLDSAGDVGQYPSITMTANGLGFVSYYDVTNDKLKVVLCLNVECTSGSQPFALDTFRGVGGGSSISSITRGFDGLGLIAYHDFTDFRLKVGHCSGAFLNCTTAAIASPDFGRYPSITIGADGRGLIGYLGVNDKLQPVLSVAHCHDVACNSASITHLDVIPPVWNPSISITIGGDGLGLISYVDVFTLTLKVAHCNNAACTSATVATLDGEVLGPGGPLGTHTSVVAGADGLGLIAYYGQTFLKVAHCNNPACSSATLTTVDRNPDVGANPSVTIGPDGLALISYFDIRNGDLKVAHCANVRCAPFGVRRR